MATIYNTSIIRDGLVLYLDAANVKSYPGSGNTWYDLTNTVNGTVVGTVAPIVTDITKCFDFTANLGLNGSTAISGFSWGPHPVPTTGSFTFNFWVKNVPATAGQGVLFSNTADANGFRFAIGANGVYYLIGPTYTEGLLGFSSFTNTQWNNVCVVFDRSGTYNSNVAQLRGYLNGNLYGSVTLPASQTAWSSNTVAYMAKGLGTFATYSGKLSKFEIYSRALSAAEITQNFNTLRGRHGL